MATDGLSGLAHDNVITIGIFALPGFQVSPATVIGLLTILGYSLYDTVVVFDKVRENTAGLLGGARTTYSQAANLALNQTLVRSINTSLIALLPVTGILVVSIALLGANNELEELALVVGAEQGDRHDQDPGDGQQRDQRGVDRSDQGLVQRQVGRLAVGGSGAAKQPGRVLPHLVEDHHGVIQRVAEDGQQSDDG